MNSKRFILIIAVSVFSVLMMGRVGGADLTNITHLKPSKIIKVEKVKRVPILKTFFSKDFQKRTESLIQAPLVYLQNSALADCYREQPFLFGFLALFTTVSLGVLAFVFHLIRNDPRFY
ncbi:hypothetical protein [Tichowtungia aerotolerans]|uniref:Uncharacterized protein n=1 Tax=Tichowtungia aerotolerans TaxID=2697043 RepID=A0A6P1MA44_9BACT|nr:hypothetical protein [Tichowtungia aerotolerans]QHI68446.1 hypothetical protein GT409_02920 [Tichowtungia aerotolerans]